MAPKLTQFRDMMSISEAFKPGTLVPDPERFLYTSFSFVEKDNTVYFGQLYKRKLQISLDEFSQGLRVISLLRLFREYPQTEMETEKGSFPGNLYLKRPRIIRYEEYRDDECLEIIPALLLEEAYILEKLSKLAPQQQHPNIIHYHGCLVQRGFITGLVLVADLEAYVVDEMGPPLDKVPFMEGLKSAIKHLHSLGLAHNDLNPRNVLVSAEGMPVLTDFDSCIPFGEKLKYSRGTPGWIDPGEDYKTSEARHDIYGLEKIRAWLDMDEQTKMTTAS